jgi:hypothetical protein
VPLQSRAAIKENHQQKPGKNTLGNAAVAIFHRVTASCCRPTSIHIFRAEKDWGLSNSGIPVVHAATKLELRN